MNIIIYLVIIIVFMITIIYKYPESKILINRKKYLKIK